MSSVEWVKETYNTRAPMWIGNVGVFEIRVTRSYENFNDWQYLCPDADFKWKSLGLNARATLIEAQRAAEQIIAARLREALAEVEGGES